MTTPSAGGSRDATGARELRPGSSATRAVPFGWSAVEDATLSALYDPRLLVVLALVGFSARTLLAEDRCPRSQPGMLVVGVLTVACSYSRNVEEPRGQVPDTVQWWIGPNGCWRIRTYALDHDIHVYLLESTPADVLALAERNTRQHYGDVLERFLVLAIDDLEDGAGTSGVLRAAGLGGQLEWSDDGFAFWNPDGASYHSQSRP